MVGLSTLGAIWLGTAGQQFSMDPAEAPTDPGRGKCHMCQDAMKWTDRRRTWRGKFYFVHEGQCDTDFGEVTRACDAGGITAPPAKPGATSGSAR